MNIRRFVVISLFLFSNLTQAFSGLYLGVSPGLLIDQVNLTSNHLGFTMPGETCNSSESFTSIAPALILGYTHEFDFGGVAGLEVDFSYNVNQTLNDNCQCPTNSTVSDRFSFFNQMQGSLRGRVGYAFFGSLMPFLTVGGSIANSGLSYSNENSDIYSTAAIMPGWLAGFGLELRLPLSLSVRGEYHFVSYNSSNLALPSIYGLTDPNGAAHASSNTSNLRVALNYWFW